MTYIARAQFHKAVEQENGWGTSRKNVNFMKIWLATSFCLSKIFLCLASFDAYRLYEIGPWAEFHKSAYHLLTIKMHSWSPFYCASATFLAV